MQSDVKNCHTEETVIEIPHTSGIFNACTIDINIPNNKIFTSKLLDVLQEESDEANMRHIRSSKMTWSDLFLKVSKKMMQYNYDWNGFLMTMNTYDAKNTPIMLKDLAYAIMKCWPGHQFVTDSRNIGTKKMSLADKEKYICDNIIINTPRVNKGPMINALQWKTGPDARGGYRAPEHTNILSHCMRVLIFGMYDETTAAKLQALCIDKPKKKQRKSSICRGLPRPLDHLGIIVEISRCAHTITSDLIRYAKGTRRMTTNGEEGGILIPKDDVVAFSSVFLAKLTAEALDILQTYGVDIHKRDVRQQMNTKSKYPVACSEYYRDDYGLSFCFLHFVPMVYKKLLDDKTGLIQLPNLPKLKKKNKNWFFHVSNDPKKPGDTTRPKVTMDSFQYKPTLKMMWNTMILGMETLEPGQTIRKTVAKVIPRYEQDQENKKNTSPQKSRANDNVITGTTNKRPRQTSRPPTPEPDNRTPLPPETPTRTSPRLAIQHPQIQSESEEQGPVTNQEEEESEEESDIEEQDQNSKGGGEKTTNNEKTAENENVVLKEWLHSKDTEQEPTSGQEKTDNEEEPEPVKRSPKRRKIQEIGNQFLPHITRLKNSIDITDTLIRSAKEPMMTSQWHHIKDSMEATLEEMKQVCGNV